ncbi:hypothetical protein OG848_27970 [Streptomyces canus]|uniref:hypothetical protein n=1 Tax=Streptomyces canus TaxID=58343 RepID=UPI00324A35BA
MTNVSIAVIVIGLILVVTGLVVFLVPVRQAPVAQGAAGEIGEVIAQVNALLDRFDKRLRPGLILMLIGVALVGLGAYLGK